MLATHDSISVINYNINYSRKVIEKSNSVVGAGGIEPPSRVRAIVVFVFMVSL